MFSVILLPAHPIRRSYTQDEAFPNNRTLNYFYSVTMDRVVYVRIGQSPDFSVPFESSRFLEPAVTGSPAINGVRNPVSVMISDLRSL